MTKHNPESKVDAFCCEIKDKLRVLRALGKSNDVNGMKKNNSGVDDLGYGILTGCLKPAAIIVGVIFIALVVLRLLKII